MKLARKLLTAAAAIAAFSGSAIAADFHSSPEAALLIAPAAAASWDGFYFGANVGYGPGTATATSNQYFGSWGNGLQSFAQDFAGPFVGAQAGYNFSTGGNVVVGVEGDLEWANETGNNGGTATTNWYYGNHIDWTGALTGHVGVALDNFMPYLLGGVAFANNTIDSRDLEFVPPDVPPSMTNTHIGMTVGAGVAMMFSPNISVFAEARYSDYGTKDYEHGQVAGPTSPGPVGLTDTTIRAGFNYHLN